MKHSPKINERLIRSPQVTAVHPLQDESTTQGILELMYRFEQMLKEISGMDRFSLQPAAGSAAIYTNVAIIRAYHAARGEAGPARRGDHDHLLPSLQCRLRQDGRI